MATELKLRRGTTTDHSTFTGAEAEATIDTTKETLVIHDGATTGGFPLAREDLSNVSSINATPVGDTTPSTGSFTNFQASGTAGFTSSGALGLPSGTEAQRPTTPVTGMLRFNTDSGNLEQYDGSAWVGADKTKANTGKAIAMAIVFG